MKAIRTILAVALAGAALATAGAAEAQVKHGGGSSGARSGGHGSGHGGHAARPGRWAGHGGGHWRGGRGHWGPSWSFAFGVPILAGSAYAWGYPYYDPYWDAPRVVYREVIRDDDPTYIGRIRPLPPEESVRVDTSREGAPTSGPLYMNYCESANAYYPKVSSCPEGWKFLSPAR